MREARNRAAVILAVLVGANTGAGCAPRVVAAPRPSADVVVVPATRGGGPRALRGVPPGHYPPPGECRLWYAGRPPGHQPPPVRCERLKGSVPRGAFVLYNGRAWDGDYDWRIREAQAKGSVPAAILELTLSLRG